LKPIGSIAKIHHRGMLWDIKVPNTETIEAMKEVTALSNNPGKDLYELINEHEKKLKRKTREAS
jgi:hypothetical protein